jgi:hypothetical protein
LIAKSSKNKSEPGGFAARKNLYETKDNRGQHFVIFQAGSRSGCQIINKKMDRFTDMAADSSRSPDASLHQTKGVSQAFTRLSQSLSTYCFFVRILSGIRPESMSTELFEKAMPNHCPLPQRTRAILMKGLIARTETGAKNEIRDCPTQLWNIFGL